MKALFSTNKNRFNAALKAYKDQKNPDIDIKDIAVDFFYGLKMQGLQ